MVMTTLETCIEFLGRVAVVGDTTLTVDSRETLHRPSLGRAKRSSTATLPSREEAIKVSVTAKPTCADHPPEWMTTASSERNPHDLVPQFVIRGGFRDQR